ncbi:LacI family DNA-binding transcriptional regulator, partial [Citrobacter freundii]
VYRQYQIPFDTGRDLLVTEGFSEDESERAIGNWLNETPREAWPEVIFCAGASMSTGIRRVLEKISVEIPGELSLMTTDVQELDAHIVAAVTSI